MAWNRLASGFVVRGMINVLVVAGNLGVKEAKVAMRKFQRVMCP